MSSFITKLTRLSKAPLTYCQARALSQTFVCSKNPQNNDNDSASIEDPKISFLKKTRDQIRANTNAFKFFKMDENYIIDENKLQKQMRQLQSQLHPDRFADQDGEMLDLSMNVSSHINVIYHILRHPYERAKYLLCIKQGWSNHDIESRLDSYKMDADFLAKMMELDEKLEDPRLAQRDLFKVHEQLSNELNSLIAEINQDFELKRYDKILGKLGKLKFLSNRHKDASDRVQVYNF